MLLALPKSWVLASPPCRTALRRLRDLFDDPLLVRTSDGMTPTDRALELQPLIRNVLAAAEIAVLPKTIFDAAASDRIFRIMASDYTEVTLLAPAVNPACARKRQIFAWIS